MMGWFYRNGNSGNWNAYFAWDNYVDCGLFANTPNFLLEPYANGNSQGTGSAIPNQTWTHLTFTADGTGSGTTFNAYFNGVLDVTGTDTQPTGTRTIYVGDDFDQQNHQGDISDVKIWTEALTADQIIQEMYTRRPVHTNNLLAWLPMHLGATERVRDYSGNGNNFTDNGVSDTNNIPPVTWGGKNIEYIVADVGGGPGPTTDYPQGIHSIEHGWTPQQAHRLNGVLQ
jgi:hypothetical protein